MSRYFVIMCCISFDTVLFLYYLFLYVSETHLCLLESFLSLVQLLLLVFDSIFIILLHRMIVFIYLWFFFFNQNTAYEMRISYWSSDVCSSDLHVTGEQWWWRVEYLEPARFTSANEIVIPVGRPALIDLASDNVIHSFWVPELAGKLDMIPGKTNRIRLLAEEPGVYFGACAEYCGGPHALMLFRVRALPPADYARWVRRESGSALPPSESLAAGGAALFQTLGCGGCHQVRGTRSRGLAGPDLTHVASRLHLGAGILPNNKGTLGGWVANPQRLKPGVKMPAYSALSARELRALVTYMDGLE